MTFKKLKKLGENSPDPAHIVESKKVTDKNDALIESEFTPYFQIREHELAFYFKINNSIFDIYLGIRKVHAVDVEKARELRKKYLGMFHPDRKGDSKSGLNYDEVCADINATFKRVSGGRL